jgi:hypothetical protein
LEPLPLEQVLAQAPLVELEQPQTLLHLELIVLL